MDCHLLGTQLRMYADWACTPIGHVRRLGMYADWACTPIGHVRRLGMYADWACTPIGHVRRACTPIGHVRRLGMYADWACTRYFSSFLENFQQSDYGNEKREKILIYSYNPNLSVLYSQNPVIHIYKADILQAGGPD